MKVGLEDQRQADRDRQPERDDDELPAGEVGEVVVEDVHRPEQLAGEFALADPPLPERRAEDDVHVPDERPDDVVRRELADGDSVDRAAMLVRDRRPDDEVDHRLGDHPDHVEVLRDAVLQLRGDRRPHRRHVEVEERPPAALLGQARGVDAHRARDCAKTSSITSSIGGSSIVRSSTSCSASRRAATRDVSAFGTRSVDRGRRRGAMTSP